MEELTYLQTDHYARSRSLRRPRFSERDGILKGVRNLRRVWSLTKQCARPLLPQFSGFVSQKSRYRILKVAIPPNGPAHTVQPARHERCLDQDWFAYADDGTQFATAKETSMRSFGA